MLETVRKNARSIFVYFIFGILIVVFILSFGPQSHRGGCSGSTPTAARVMGREITETTWRYGILALTGGGNASGERARRQMLRERALDNLIAREILADSAEQMGFRISDEEVRDKIVNGDIYVIGQKVDGKRVYFIKGEGDDQPRFLPNALKQFVAARLGINSVERFLEEEKRELLAAKVRDLVAAAVRVSPEEVQHRYELDSSKVEIEYVAFQPGSYRANIDLSPADIDAYLKAHEADLHTSYDKEADRWKGRDKEVRVRDLFVKSEKPAEPTPPEPAPGATPAPPPAPAPTKPDPAKAKAEAALAKIKGGADFVTVAKGMNPDLKHGGDLGWRPLRGLRLGEEVATAVGRLKKGETTAVIERPEGFHIVQLIDERQGDLAFDAVKRDLAEEAALDDKAKAAAKADADKALAAAKAGTPLDKQYPPAAEGGEPPAAPGATPRTQKGTDITRVGGYIPGIGTSKELVTALFDVIGVGELAGQVYEVSGDYFVVRLTKREQPDMAKFQTEKPKLAAQMAKEKSLGVVAEYVSRRCNEARDRGSISYDPTYVTYTDLDAATKPAYIPCQTLRQ